MKVRNSSELRSLGYRPSRSGKEPADAGGTLHWKPFKRARQEGRLIPTTCMNKELRIILEFSLHNDELV